MTDGSEKIEAELAGMRPAAVSNALADRIDRALAVEPHPMTAWRDWALVGSALSGGLAAAVILTLLIIDPARSSMTPSFPSPPAAVVPPPRFSPGRVDRAFLRGDTGLAWQD